MKLIDIRNQLPRHATKKWVKRKNVSRIIIHCTGGTNQDPFTTAHYHVGPNHISKTGCPGLCYHDYITSDGTVYHCNNYQDKTWHAGIYNRTSVGIVMAYTGGSLAPPEEQYLAMVKQTVKLCLYLKVLPKNVIGHREVPGMYTILGKGSRRYKSVCPGMQINLDRLRREVTLRLQRRLYIEKLYKGKLDGLFGPLSEKALYSFEPRRSIFLKTS